jgi:hypothetical protein
MTLFPDLNGAQFSADRTYRYRLWRIWDPDKPLWLVVMCNASDGNEVDNDPTLRRVEDFCSRDGAGGYVVVNLFGLVDSNPKTLKEVDDPVGPDNDAAIEYAVQQVMVSGEGGKVVVAWGDVGGQFKERVAEVLRRLPAGLWCLGATTWGHPCHPLYLPKTTKLEPWPVPKPPKEHSAEVTRILGALDKEIKSYKAKEADPTLGTLYGHIATGLQKAVEIVKREAD